MIEMAEYVANAVQTVQAGQNVLLTEDIIPCNRGYVIHREGSGIFTLRGIVNNPTCGFARYFVFFGGNIAIPEDGTVEPISLAIAIDGEIVPTSEAIFTPAAVGDFGNVNVFAYVTVPKGCCFTVAVENAGTAAIEVANSNLVINRVA